MQFGILGPLEVTGADGPVEIRGPKLRALVAILLVRANEVVSTDRLVEDLWGGDPPPNATATLHSYVSQLRKSLGRGQREGLITRPPGYVLRAASDELDATCFESLAADGRRALTEDHADTAAKLLVHALGLWRGSALAEFADLSWARGEIARLGELRDQCAEDRIDAELDLGRAAELVPEVERLVDEQPLRERRWGQLMLALYRSNRQAEALRTFQNLRRRLGEELGIEPSRDLARLEEDILLQRPELLARPARTAEVHAAIVASPPVEPVGRSVETIGAPAREVFVGRSEELERLGAALEHLEPGARRLVLVSGAPGIGKTSLVATFARTASERGAVVLWGRSDEEVLVPYQPFVEAVRDWARAVPVETLRTTLGVDASEIAHHVPAVARLLPNVADPPPADPETERYRWFEALASVLAAIAGRAPTVLVVDDLHAADKPTLLLLKHLLRHPGDAPMLVVGTVRDLDAGSEALADLRHEGVLERIELGGLAEEAVEAMVEAEAAVALGPAGRSLAHVVYEQTEGSPFFVTELMRHLRETGRLADVGEAVASTSIEDLGIPPGVRDVVASRIARLSAPSRGLLSLAAVLGPEFEPGVLRRIADTDLDAVIDALDEAERARLVAPMTGTQRYRFSHAIVREALYADVSAMRRQALHERITIVLESLNREHPDEYLPGLAYHSAQAAPLVDPRTAIDYARRAGDEAASRAAHELAARHYQRALDVIARVDLRDDPLRCQLLLARGLAHNRAGDVGPGKEACAAAAEIARTLARPDLLARAALAYGGQLPATPDIDDPRMVELLDEALTALGPGDSPARALVLGRRAQWLHQTAAPEVERRMCDESIAIARRAGDPAVLAVVLHSRYWALFGPDDVEERVAVATEIAMIGEQLAEPELILQGTQCRLHAVIELGDAEAARETAARRTELARALRQPHYLWAVAAYDAMTAATEGRLDEAEQLAHAAFAMRRRSDPVSATTVYAAQMQQVRWLQGRMAEIIETHERLAARDPDRPTWWSALAWARAEAGDLEGAAASLARLTDYGLERLPRNFEWYASVAGMAIACRRLGDADAAARLYPLLLPYADRNCTAGQSAFYGAAAHHLGTLAATMGRTDDALHHFEAAARRHRAFGADPLVALTEQELAASR